VRRLLGSLAVVALLAAACDADEQASKPVREADHSCDGDREDGFYADNATYVDDEVIELPVAQDPSVDTDVLEQATDEIARSRSPMSFIVVRKGKVVWERYLNGSDPTHAENVHSLSKSILSLIVEHSIGAGALELSTRIRDVLPRRLVPESAPDLTVRDLLTMSAGLRWEENVTEQEIADERSYVRAVLSQGRETPAGKKFQYSTGLTQVLSAVIAEATGKSTCEYARDALFEPLGITADNWPTDPDGYHTGGHSLFLTPREIARLGMHVLDEDLDDEQVWDDGCGAPGERRGYGRLWWHSTIGDTHLQRADGFGGQALVLAPDHDLAMVMTSNTFGDDFDVVPPLEVMTNYVLPAAGVHVEPDRRCASFDLQRHDLREGTTGRLTDHISHDVFGEPSPDATHIAFHSRRDLNWEIYLMDADGSDERRLTLDGATDSFPRWSPDGRRIVFSRDARDRSGIYTMRPDGTDVQRLTTGRDITPAWSPDGRRIVFSRATTQPDEHTLWLMDADGSDERRIEEGFLGVQPDWSPDSEEIAFTSRNGREHVYTIGADGGGRRRVAEGRDPRFMPDGSLVFASKGGIRDTYRIVRRTRNGIVALVDTPGHDVEPSPSADGRFIVYATAAAGSVDP
jgi:CubicO group peptidase (beta-lactamase class C family)